VRGHGILLALSMTFAAVAASSEVFSQTSPPKLAVTVRREITIRLPVAVCCDEIRAKLAEAP
jgi:hypothetical protein